MKPRNKSRLAAPLLMGLLVTVLSGCNKEQPPPPQGAASPAAKAKAPVQQRLSSLKPPPPQETFDFSGKKDPFRSYVVASKAKLPLPPISEIQLPIQKFEVSQFKVLGIITGLKENRAMVLDPTGKSYVIKEGSLIGPHNGKVQAITPTVIDVIEQYRNESGQIKTRVVKLALPRKE